MPSGTIPNDALLFYHRQGELIRFKTEAMTNHELRELMVGLWARLSAEDRADHIRELQHYDTEAESWLSDVASGISRAVAGENAIDLRDIARRVHGELPS